MEPPPPPPPPHGANAPGGRSGGLPDGKYDIFVIPPSSSGAGFLYLPSLQTQRNSFLAGVACTATTFFIYSIAVPVIKEWFQSTVSGGGSGILLIIMAVAVLSWAFGKTQGEGAAAPGSGAGSGGGSTNTNPAGASGPNASHFNANGPDTSSGAGFGYGAAPPPKSSWQRPPPQANTKAGTTNGKSSWEKAREETRKREEEKRKLEELKKKREELEKERSKQREKELRERLERETKEKKDREEKERLDKERVEKEAEARRTATAAAASTSPRRPPMPTARTEEDDDAYSFRPYDRPKRTHKANSAASMYSESSYAASQTTAKTTPPPSQRGPYTTKDPDKVILKGVYSFNNAFMRTPVSQLISGKGSVTDGLILRITTEGLFIDDDVRQVPQREWDVKAWTMKLAESCEIGGLHILRASIRDQEGKRYVFILSKSEGWKVALGLQRLRRGSQVRALGVAGLPQNEAKALVDNLGWT